MFRYKLNTNTASGAKNLYNYKEFSTTLYENLNAGLDKKQLKTIEDFSKTIPKSTDPQEQIWNIENKIKKSIIFDRYIGRKQTLTDVIKTKQANETDIIKLYNAVFRYFNIENNIVFTSSRGKTPFDKSFESYENLNDLLFYFPAIKKYLTPTQVEYRIPMIPANLASNYGLFIKEKCLLA